MNTLSDRFRTWYEYERDCNAKILAMLESVPEERRSHADFQRAVDLAAHLAAARQIWLSRLGHWEPAPTAVYPQGTALEDLHALFQDTELAWTRYLSTLVDDDLPREFEYRQIATGMDRKNQLEIVLTHMFGHAFYHRGQVSLLVTSLGGETPDTDYMLWSPAPPSEFAT